MKLGCSYCNECAACGSQHFAKIKELCAANAELVKAVDLLRAIINAKTKDEPMLEPLINAANWLDEHGNKI